MATITIGNQTTAEDETEFPPSDMAIAIDNQTTAEGETEFPRRKYPPAGDKAKSDSEDDGDAGLGPDEETTESSDDLTLGSNAGAVAGISVGAVVIFLAATLYCLYRRTLAKEKDDERPGQLNSQQPESPTRESVGKPQDRATFDEENPIIPTVPSSLSELREQIQLLKVKVKERHDLARRLASLVEERKGSCEV